MEVGSDCDVIRYPLSAIRYPLSIMRREVESGFELAENDINAIIGKINNFHGEPHG
ncbi:MAG: hypothetical protein ACR2PT_08955 [Endozoicomonas sp.]